MTAHSTATATTLDAALDTGLARLTGAVGTLRQMVTSSPRVAEPAVSGAACPDWHTYCQPAHDGSGDVHHRGPAVEIPAMLCEYRAVSVRYSRYQTTTDEGRPSAELWLHADSGAQCVDLDRDGLVDLIAAATAVLRRIDGA